MGGLTITPGKGGNGGTRDGLFLSAKISAGAVTGSIDDSSVRGFGMTGVITYSSDVFIALDLSAYDDAVTVAVANTSSIYMAKVGVRGGPGTDTITGCLSPACFLYAD